MLSDFLNKPTLRLFDYLLDFNEVPFGVEEVSKFYRVDSAGLLQKFADYEIITCTNPEAEPFDRKYLVNQKSNIFSLSLKLDFEISTFMVKQKRQKVKESDKARQIPFDKGRSHLKEKPHGDKGKFVSVDANDKKQETLKASQEEAQEPPSTADNKPVD
jgi:hypothetical protein